MKYRRTIGLCLIIAGFPLLSAMAQQPKAMIDGSGPGWKSMGKADFVRVNDNDDTWQFSEEGIFCTGQPVGVIRTAKSTQTLSWL